MRKQQQIWAAEHATSASLTKMAGEEPASGVVAFVHWLKEHAAKPGRAVDIGSGKGRNAIYLAQQGYVVDALEYIAIARQHTKTLAKAKGLETKVHSKDVEIDGCQPPQILNTQFLLNHVFRAAIRGSQRKLLGSCVSLYEYACGCSST